MRVGVPPRSALAICFSAIAAVAAAAQTVDVQIRLSDKRIYYVNRPEEVRLKVSLVNNGPAPYRFRLADDRVYNLDFEVKTLSNQQLSHSQDFITARSTDQYVFFRDVELSPGEEYSFDVTLERFIKLDQPGVLTIRAFFYPELFRGPQSPKLLSNSLAFQVRPALVSEAERQLIDQDTREVLTRSPLPPDEVVEFTIRARQQSQMHRFLLYLDVERLMLSSPDWKRRYDRMDEVGRRRLVGEYQELLLQGTVDQDIQVIPSEFSIQETAYTPFRGTVKVLEKFKYRDYTELKEYTYRLERRDRVWMIVGYDVMNIGTE